MPMSFIDFMQKATANFTRVENEFATEVTKMTQMHSDRRERQDAKMKLPELDRLNHQQEHK